MTVVVGVDGAGRTRRLGEIVTAATKQTVRVDDPDEPPEELAARLAAAAADDVVVVIDDAHRLPAPLLQGLARAGRNGAELVITRRPTIDSPELAELDRVATTAGGVEVLEPLDETALAALLVGATGRPASPEDVHRLHEASAGLPALATLLAGAPSASGWPPTRLVVRVQQQLTLLDPTVAGLARVLALGLDLADDVLLAVTGLAPGRLGAAMRELRDAGLLATDERLIPAVAESALADLSPAERRRLHDHVATALVEAGEDPVVAGGQLRAARVRTPRAAGVYAAAGDRLRFDDPAAAVSWYDQALDAGADTTTVAAGRAEAAALLGHPAETDSEVATPAETVRLALVAGAVAAHHGRPDRAADALLGGGATGKRLAVPSLVALGRTSDAAEAAAAGGRAPTSLQRLAEAVLAVDEPEASLPRLIEAAEELEGSPPPVVLPDTPHAIGAIVAVAAGDAATAQDLLERALARGIGGPLAFDRHRALLAWVQLRSGRYATAVAELPRLAGLLLPGRERLLVAALSAGLARRSGDIAQLREAWAFADPVLARQTADLFVMEPLEELLVAAARLGEHRRVAPVLDTLDEIVAGLGRPAVWAAQLGWIRLQVAIAGEDADGVVAAADRVDEMAAPARARALSVAAQQWAQVLAGDPDADAVVEAAETLAAAELPWEASRLVGQAAIRVADPARARSLLERARAFVSSDGLIAGGDEADRGGLSDRELEVAGLVLAGRTYKEIGAQLYLSPKTVEHHVARIRTKLGAKTRAELLAALREILPDDA